MNTWRKWSVDSFLIRWPTIDFRMRSSKETRTLVKDDVSNTGSFAIPHSEAVRVPADPFSKGI